MSAPLKPWEGNSDPVLSNATPAPSIGTPSFLNPMPTTSAMDYPSPALPPRPDLGMMQPSYGLGAGGFGYGGMGQGGFGMGGMGGYGGMGYGSMGGGYGMGSPYGGYGGFNRYGPMHGDMESRFIQLAEESSRPAFDSIQSVVNAIGSVAMMLENTFIAMTSSFRAILGVAENFGRLRSLFAQFWSTFAIIRSINWLIRKLLVMLGIRTECEFKAWAQAVAATQSGSATPEQKQRGSSWPILMFFGVVAAAPYIIHRLLSGMTSSINERLNDPSSWQTPLRALAQLDYQAASPQDISFKANQIIHLAPQHLQANLWNSGWLMGSADRQTAGLVPVSYVKVIRPNSQEPVKVSEHNDTPGSLAPTYKMLNEDKRVEPNLADLEKYYSEEL